MNLPKIQSLWIGNPLSNLEKLCVQSFLDHGHQFHLYTYADIGNVPRGAVIKDANEILPESSIYYQQEPRSKASSFSNWFRWALLAKQGGYWVDMDIACLRPFNFTDEIIFSRESRGYFTPSVLCFPKAHEFPVFMEKWCAQRPNKETAAWGETGGPKTTTKYIHEFGLQNHAKPETYFQPIDWSLWHTAFDQTFADDIAFFKTTHAIHFANEMIFVDKNARFDSASFFEQLKARHKIANLPNAPTITSEQLHTMLITKETHRATRQKYRAKRTRYLILLAFALGVAIGALLL